MFIGWLTMGLRGNKATLAILEGLIGITIIYLVVASGTFYEGRIFDMAWPAKLTGADLEASAFAGVIFSLLAAVYVWRKTIGIVADDYSADRLQRSFKIGIAVIAVGVLAEEISKTDVGIQTLLVPFFAASLAGLAAARLPEHGLRGKGAAWARIIAAAILGVIALGLILGLLGGIYGGVGVRLLYRGWGLLVDALLWILRYPLELLVNLMLLIFNWLKSMFGSEEQPEQEFGGGPPGGLPEGITETAGDSQLFETIFNIIQYPLLAILIIGLFLFLALAYRKFIAREGRGEDEDRESLDTDADPTKDLMRLLAGLLPSWFTRSSEKPREMALSGERSRGDRGFLAVLRLPVGLRFKGSGVHAKFDTQRARAGHAGGVARSTRWAGNRIVQRGMLRTRIGQSVNHRSVEKRACRVHRPSRARFNPRVTMG